MSATARRWARGGYLLMLAAVLLSPLEFRLDAGFLAERMRHFFSPGVLTTGDMVDAVRNVLLLAGWGLVEVVTDVGRSGRDRVRSALLGGAAIGVGAEIAQLALPPRIPSLLDATMNAGGAGLGAALTHVALRSASSDAHADSSRGVAASVLAAPYALAVLVETTFPAFRSVEDELMSGGPLERAVWTFRNFSLDSITVVPAIEFLLFLPAGYLLGLAFAGTTGREAASGGRTFRRAAVVGVGLAVVGELARAPLGMPVQLGPFLVHSAALVLGAWLAVHLEPTQSIDGEKGPGVRQYLFGYGLILVLWRLRPFVPHTDPSAIARELTGSNWSPLFILTTRGDLYSAADILRTFLLFVPLGALIGAVGPRHSRRGSSNAKGVAWILGSALLLELGQALIAGRLFDGTDLVVMAAGGIVAWAVVRRARGT